MTLNKTQKAVTGRGSPLRKYQDVMVGSRSLWFFLYFEWCGWLAVIPGALGMVLRQVFWPRLFGSCGRKVAFASGIVLRHPGRIHLGDSVVIGEGCILDARNSETERAIVLENNVILSTNVMLSCKEGTITIGENCGLNAGTIIQSTNGCPVVIGKDTVIGQMCFVVGGGNYNMDRFDIPIRLQGIRHDGGVLIGEDVWLGARATVLGGVEIGAGSVVAAAGVVTGAIPPRSIAKGVPARVTGTRNHEARSCA